jgi:hypothetical protein|nr:MAG TPA: hypothetical protein [Bacteriophage sp.]
MNRQELEKIVKPLEWDVYSGGAWIRAETIIQFNFRLERVGEHYLVQRDYLGDTTLEYHLPVSLEAAKEIAWAKYLDTVASILKD